METMVYEPTNINTFAIDKLFRNSKGRVVDAPSLGGAVADTHCHLDMLDHPGLALARCAAHGVSLVVTVVDACEKPEITYDSLAQWLGDAFGVLERWGERALLPTVRVVAGCHPHNASKFDRATAETVARCAAHPLTVAVGEIGLDYHYDLSPRDVQREVFKRQLAMANELGKPVVLHIREAHDDALDILGEQGMPAAGTLIHCFTSDWDTLAPFLDLGCYVAFGGALTFNKGDDIREAARRAPLDRILTETDAPYMAPVPLRGTVCTPECVIFTTAALAEARGVGEDGIAGFLAALYANAQRFYGLE